MGAEITTAITFDPVRGVAGIAGTLRGGRVVCIDVVEAEGKLAAYALAVLRQVEITALPHSSAATILTPSSLLLACLAGDVEPMGERTREYVRLLQRRLAQAGSKIALHFAPPKEGSRRAYIAARQGYKTWLAGLEGKRETWSPRPAMDEAEAAA